VRALDLTDQWRHGHGQARPWATPCDAQLKLKTKRNYAERHRVAAARWHRDQRILVTKDGG
jgi:hypothetical protein